MTIRLNGDALSLLIIDDDRELCALVAEIFSQEGIHVSCAATAADGFHALAGSTHDVIVLDLMLKDSNGLDVCRHLRQSGNDIPILMLTARGDPMDRVLGLEIGADDYLAKPFEPRELVARVRALGRRRRALQQRTQLNFFGMTIDLLAHRTTCNGDLVTLTSTEFKLLVAMAMDAGQPVGREVLSAAVQPGTYMPLERAVDVQIARLRKKLPQQENGSEWIQTVRGEGYVFTGIRR